MPDPIRMSPSQFTAADDTVNWTQVGPIVGFHQTGNRIDLDAGPGKPAPRLTFLSPTVFRLRFNATGNYDSGDFSYAVVTQDLCTDSQTLTVTATEDPLKITVQSGQLTVEILKNPFAVNVFKGDQLISADAPRSLVYCRESVANFKTLANGAIYCGFGEKAGRNLNKRGATMSFFNFDALAEGYGESDSLTLYISIPLLIEVNPCAPVPYSYGLFLDNPSQTFFDVGLRKDGQYYCGAV